MIIFYGIPDFNVDVTQKCLKNLTKKNIISIPCNDNTRAQIFTDPVFCVPKYITILKSNGERNVYDDTISININILDETIELLSESDVQKKLLDIQSNLQIKHGSFFEEIVEQKMAVRYLTGNEKVLEIGGNIGRNSLIIAYILNKQKNNNFVTLESDAESASLLCENRNLNNLKFFIEPMALSKKKLIQQGWNTIQSDVLLDGYKWVNTIDLNSLMEKYKIQFDTLILDCEGAFYYILIDMPEILNNINLIIIENDFTDNGQKQYVDNVLRQNNFYIDYYEAGGWGESAHCFWQVWKKNSSI